MAISLKGKKIHLTYDSATPLPSIYPRREMKTSYGHSKTFIGMFMEALLLIAKNWKQSKCLSTFE